MSAPYFFVATESQGIINEIYERLNKFDNFEDAKKEAERLAKFYPEKEIFIFEQPKHVHSCKATFVLKSTSAFEDAKAIDEPI